MLNEANSTGEHVERPPEDELYKLICDVYAHLSSYCEQVYQKDIELIHETRDAVQGTLEDPDDSKYIKQKAKRRAREAPAIEQSVNTYNLLASWGLLDVNDAPGSKDSVFRKISWLSGICYQLLPQLMRDDQAIIDSYGDQWEKLSHADKMRLTDAQSRIESTKFYSEHIEEIVMSRVLPDGPLS